MRNESVDHPDYVFLERCQNVALKVKVKNSGQLKSSLFFGHNSIVEMDLGKILALKRLDRCAERCLCSRCLMVLTIGTFQDKGLVILPH